MNNQDHQSLLPESTRKLWRFLQSEVKEYTSGWVLVGGTAITLHIGHRISHDLDLVWAHPRCSLNTEDLPRRRMDRLLNAVSKKFRVDKAVNIGDEQDFMNDGLDLDDFQQDFIISGVKVTFFKGSRDVCDILNATPLRYDALHIASLDQLFQMKCIAINERQKSRDYFDVYTMIKDYGYNLEMARKVIESEVRGSWDLFCSRLARLPVSATDEGYDVCVSDASKMITLDAMRDFFLDVMKTADHQRFEAYTSHTL